MTEEAVEGATLACLALLPALEVPVAAFLPCLFVGVEEVGVEVPEALLLFVLFSFSFAAAAAAAADLRSPFERFRCLITSVLSDTGRGVPFIF